MNLLNKQDLNLSKEARWNDIALKVCMDKIRKQYATVAIVIPLFFSSGALSISSKATALAFPSSAST